VKIWQWIASVKTIGRCDSAPDSFRRLLMQDGRRSMNKFNRKSIKHAYKHMILSVTHSPQSICTKFTSSWNKFTKPAICFSLTAVLYIVKTAAQSHYQKTIGMKQSVGAIVVRQSWLSADMIVRWDYCPNPNNYILQLLKHWQVEFFRISLHLQCTSFSDANQPPFELCHIVYLLLLAAITLAPAGE